MRITPRLAVAVTIVILAAVNVVDVRVPHAALVVGPCVAALLLWLARLAGLSWRNRARPGDMAAGAALGGRGDRHRGRGHRGGRGAAGDPRRVP